MWIKPNRLVLCILGLTSVFFWAVGCGNDYAEEQDVRSHHQSAVTEPEEILIEVTVPEPKMSKSVEQAPSVNTATSYQPTAQPMNLPVSTQNYGAQAGFAGGAIPGATGFPGAPVAGAAAHHGVVAPGIAPGVVPGAPGVPGPAIPGPGIGVPGPIPGPIAPGPWFGPAFPFPVSDLILVDDDDHHRDDDDDEGCEVEAI